MRMGTVLRGLGTAALVAVFATTAAVLATTGAGAQSSCTPASDALVVTCVADDPAHPLPGMLRYIVGHARPGSTITFQGAKVVQLAGNLTVDTPNLTITGGGVAGAGQQQINVLASNVTFTGIHGFTEVVLHVSAPNVTVTGSTFVLGPGDPPAIAAFQSRGLTVTGNDITRGAASDAAVEVDTSDGATVSGNAFSTSNRVSIGEDNSQRLTVKGNNGDGSIIVSPLSGSIEQNTISASGAGAARHRAGAERAQAGTRAHAAAGGRSPASNLIQKIFAGRPIMFVRGSTLERARHVSVAMNTINHGSLYVERNDVSVDNNTVSDGSAGVGASCVDGDSHHGPVQITHNTADRDVVGISYRCSDRVQQGQAITISDNTVKDSDNRGLIVDTRRATLERDTVTKSGHAGVEVGSEARNVTLTDMTVTTRNEDGMAFDRGAHARVIRGTIQYNRGAGAWIDRGAQVMISRTSFGYNDGPGIDVAPRGVTTDFSKLQANGQRGWPDTLIFNQQRQRIEGEARGCAGCRIEGFGFEGGDHKGNILKKTPYGEGAAFVAETITNKRGYFVWPKKVTSCPESQMYTFTVTKFPRGRALGARAASLSPAHRIGSPVTSEFSPPPVCTLDGIDHHHTGGGGSPVSPGGGSPGSQTTPGYHCVGNEVTVFDNTNVGAVKNGGGPPTFSTGGKPYCLQYIQTYHWNDGNGALPGTLGLVGMADALGGARTLGPWPAVGSSGQNGAPNVNWRANVPHPPPIIIEGTYQCKDSDPTTWSWNDASGGLGFCIVGGITAVRDS